MLVCVFVGTHRTTAVHVKHVKQGRGLLELERRPRKMPFEHRLNTIKLGAEVQNENRVSCIARTRLTKTLCSLLSIDSRLPKLDVAGSSPVSRSRNKGLICSAKYDVTTISLLAEKRSRWGGGCNTSPANPNLPASVAESLKHRTLPRIPHLVEKPLLDFPHRLLFHIKGGLRVLILIDVDAVSHNIGSRLGVHAPRFALSGERASHSLEIDVP